MTTIDDQHYIEQILKGDTKAFAILINRYKDLVFSLTYRMIKNREEAEEVAQDIFLKIYKSLSAFRGESKFSTWIYKVAYRTCLDHLRKNKNTFIISNIDEFTENQLISIDDSLSQLEADERRQSIQNCLTLLPGEDSFLLTLYYFEEKTLDEIAEIMGLTNNHIKVKIFRSRNKLAAILKNQLEPDLIDIYERKRK